MLKKLALSIFILIFSFVTISVTWVFIHKYVPVYRTPLMYLKALDKKDFNFKVQWKSISEIKPIVGKVMISSEDHKFYEHNGFDFKAIQHAINHNKKGKTTIGASTISQQVAKNVFLWPHRSWIRKGLEAYFTVLVELIWSKERILEVYLNVIELGDGIYGVEASAQKYFKKSASKLTLDESALMAAVLPNPIRFKINNPSNYVKRRQRLLIGYERGFPRKPRVVQQIEEKVETNSHVLEIENREELDQDLQRELEELELMMAD